MGATLGLIGAGTSLVSGLGSLFGGGGNNMPAPPPTYQYQNMGSADANAIQGIGQLPQYNTWASSLPAVSNIVNKQVNNPYAATAQSGANTTAGIGWGTGINQVGGGNALIGAGTGVLPYSQAILSTGFDPQNDLYNRSYQQNLDATRAGQAARGIAMTPYGAGLEDMSNRNFNIDWQNNLLNRQNTAAQGAGYLLNSGGNAINLGQNVGTLGLQTLGNAAALPYTTYNNITGNQLGAYNTLGQFGANATNTANIPIEDYLKYLSGGTGANATANQAYANALTAQNNQFNQQQKIGQNIGSGLSGLGKNWPSSWNFTGGWGPSSAGQSGSPYYGPAVSNSWSGF